MDERIKGRNNFPTDDIDPDNFLSDEEVRKLIETKDQYKFTQDDYKKIYNCVHCGECETEDERFLLKEKFLEDGNTFEGIEKMNESYEKYRSPYPSNKMRIRIPEGIPEKSDTLYFMGCICTIRIPRYTEHSIDYLMKQNIDFTILETEICCGWPWISSKGLNCEEFKTVKEENIAIFKKFKKVICLCPTCYFLFETYLKPEMDTDTEFEFITEYFKPPETKKTGEVGVQHLCQLMNRGFEGVDEQVDNVLKDSGYKVLDVPHWCCGGGAGYMHRKDVIDKIAEKRMSDFSEGDYATTYCPGCWWILTRFGKKHKIKPKPKDIFELLM